MLLFGYEAKSTHENEIIIKMEDEYTEDFIVLLEDYYLTLTAD